MMNKKHSSKYHLLRYVVSGMIVGGIVLSLNYSKAGVAFGSIPAAAADTIPGVIMPPSKDGNAKIKMSWLGVTEEAFKNGVHPLYVVDNTEMELAAFMEYRKSHEAESHYKVKVVKAADATKIYGDKAEHGAFIITSHQGHSVLPPPPPPPPPGIPPPPPPSPAPPPPPALSVVGIKFKKGEPRPMIIIDGKEEPYEMMEKMNPDDIKSVSVFKNSDERKKQYKDAKNGVIVIVTKKNDVVDTRRENFLIKSRDEKAMDSALFIINGIKSSKTELDKMDKSDIESVNVLKGESATTIYGAGGKNGVILVTTKYNKNKDTTHTMKPVDVVP